MAIAQGNYLVLNYANRNLALDIIGATGTNGTNIRLFTRNDSDAQIVTVINYSGSDTQQVLRFPLTWGCIDVPRGVGHGSNVWQWAWNDSINQRWLITQDGTKTATVDGETYPVYKVAMAANSSYVLASNENQSAVTSGTNVCIDLDSADGGNQNDRRWVFIPLNGLADGVYRFMPSNAQNVSVGVTGKAGDVQIYMHANADTNYQRWIVKKTSATSGQTYISSRGDGWKATAVSTANGADIRLGDDSHGNLQKWVVVQDGTGTFNGQNYPLVEIRCVAGVNLVWDAQGGVPTTKVNTKLISHTENDGPNQKWLAVPESWLDSSIPAPSDCKVAYSSGGNPVWNLWTRSTQNFVPAFKSTGKQFQMRYRTRSRLATSGDTVFGGWSAWKSISNNSTALDGWGVETSPNCAVVSSGGRYYAKAIPITLSVTGNDCVEVQYQVREWRKASSTDISHGNVATFTGRVKWKPQLTVSSIRWSPDGYRLYYSSDQKRDNNDFTVYSVTVTDATTHTAIPVFSGEYTINDVPRSGSMVIPASTATYIPNPGDTVSVTGRWTNVDGAYNKAEETFTKTLTYDTGRNPGLISATMAVDDAYMLDANANLSDGSLYELYIDYESDGQKLHVFTSEDGTWKVPPAFYKPFTATVVVKKGTQWDIEKQVFDAISPRPRIFLFNYQKDNGDWGFFQLFSDVEKSASIQRSIANDYRADNTMGGSRRQDVHFGYGRQESGVVTGTHLKDSSEFPTGVIWPMETGQSRYCWLRPANSEVYRVAITGFNIDEERFDRSTYTVNYILMDAISSS